MNGIHLDQEAFVRHLRAGTAQPELTSRAPQLLQNRNYTHLSITDGCTGGDPNRKHSKFE
jgi:hypothetical protein